MEMEIYGKIEWTKNKCRIRTKNSRKKQKKESEEGKRKRERKQIKEGKRKAHEKIYEKKIHFVYNKRTTDNTNKHSNRTGNCFERKINQNQFTLRKT